MRVIFMGSPEFALPALRRLIESEHEVAAVYTQPDRPVGRGRKLQPPPVKTLALQQGLDVRQPASISAPHVVEELQLLAPDVGVIAAYGQILKQPVLDVPRLGILNVHASLLPRWRGAAPIPAAILAGDAETGATIMKVVLALDAGPVLDSVAVPIAPGDTTGTLTPRVAEAGATLLRDVLPRWEAGEIDATAQDDALATYAPQLKKSDALIHWDRDGAETIWRQVRAYNPWPMAYTYAGIAAVRILECMPLDGTYDGAPGTVVVPGSGRAEFAVVARDGALGVSMVQAAGGKPMRAAEYINGHRDLIGRRLTAEPGAT